MQNKKLLRSHDDERDDTEYVQGRESAAAAAAANVDLPRAHSTNARRKGPLRYLLADRKATQLVFVVTAAAAAGRKVSARRGEACGAGSDSRVMGGSAHSSCQSQPSYPLNG